MDMQAWFCGRLEADRCSVAGQLTSAQAQESNRCLLTRTPYWFLDPQ